VSFTSDPRWRTELRYQPEAKGGSWFVDVRRQDRKGMPWRLLGTAQGKTLSVALSAASSLAKRQEISRLPDPDDPTKTVPKYPELV